MHAHPHDWLIGENVIGFAGGMSAKLCTEGFKYAMRSQEQLEDEHLDISIALQAHPQSFPMGECVTGSDEKVAKSALQLQFGVEQVAYSTGKHLHPQL